MNNLSKFQTYTEYVSGIGLQGFPNVSLIQENGEVYYNPDQPNILDLIGNPMAVYTMKPNTNTATQILDKSGNGYHLDITHVPNIEGNISSFTTDMYRRPIYQIDGEYGTSVKNDNFPSLKNMDFTVLYDLTATPRRSGIVAPPFTNVFTFGSKYKGVEEHGVALMNWNVSGSTHRHILYATTADDIQQIYLTNYSEDIRGTIGFTRNNRFTSSSQIGLDVSLNKETYPDRTGLILGFIHNEDKDPIIGDTSSLIQFRNLLVYNRILSYSEVLAYSKLIDNQII